ncbi:MAG: hypothetical protein AAF988_04485 [Pseudomonadota bacterium]
MAFDSLNLDFRLVHLFVDAASGTLIRASDKILLIFDVDLTLRDTMCTNTPPEQRSMMLELYERTSGGVILKSGRSASALDATFDGALPLSGEHHSCMRIRQNGSVISLAPEVDTSEIAGQAVEEIDDLIQTAHRIVNTPDAVRDNIDKTIAVYPEVKQYAVALVHSLNHHSTDIKRFQGQLEIAANQAIEHLGLQDTHETRTGSDAVEIVAKGMTPGRAQELLQSGELPEGEIQRILKDGLHKGTALHNFMSLPAFSGRTPFMIGDSGTDGVAMIEARKYGGGGVWVLNENPIQNVKPEYQEAVSGRYIPTHEITWDHISEAIDHLRETQKVYAAEALPARSAPAYTGN